MPTLGRTTNGNRFSRPMPTPRGELNSNTGNDDRTCRDRSMEDRNENCTTVFVASEISIVISVSIRSTVIGRESMQYSVLTPSRI